MSVIGKPAVGGLILIKLDWMIPDQAMNGPGYLDRSIRLSKAQGKMHRGGTTDAIRTILS